MAPTNAKVGSARKNKPVSPVAMAMTAPTAPPAETPMMPGSAIGLRNSPCIVAPAIPEGHADRSAHDDPGEPDLLDDKLLGAPEVGEVEPEKRQQDRGDVAGGDVDGPEAEGYEGGRQYEQDEDG